MNNVMNKKVLILTLLTIVLALPAMAQGRKNVRFNEIMVQQDSLGGYGNGWVELYNSSYGTNAVEKMFITTLSKDAVQAYFDLDKNKGKKGNEVLQNLSEAQPDKCYEIPRGDERNTKIGPRTHFVFEADGDAKAGTFHLPFTLTNGKDNYIALYDVNGDLVDEVTIPASLKPGETYAIKVSKGAETLPSVLGDGKTEWEVRDGKTLETAITKGNYNTRAENENIELFHEKDPHGYWIALIAMAVVFLALIMLYLCFKLFGYFSKRSAGEQDTQAAAAAAPVAAAAPQGDANGEAMAAICMALYQHLNAHDNESGVLTLTPRDHTSWGDKSGLLRKLPR